MKKSTTNKWWETGKEYNYDVRRKLEAEECKAAELMMIECKVKLETEETCQQYLKEFREC